MGTRHHPLRFLASHLFRISLGFLNLFPQFIHLKCFLMSLFKRVSFQLFFAVFYLIFLEVKTALFIIFSSTFFSCYYSSESSVRMFSLSHQLSPMLCFYSFFQLIYLPLLLILLYLKPTSPLSAIFPSNQKQPHF